jgi:ATP-binding cassette, subfamily F, member 3
MADKQIPGQPWNLRVLLLGQTRELTLEEAVGGLRVGEESVLQHVIRSDAVRERYSREAKRKFSASGVFSLIN